jgi:hypothetical protein
MIMSEEVINANALSGARPVGRWVTVCAIANNPCRDIVEGVVRLRTVRCVAWQPEISKLKSAREVAAEIEADRHHQIVPTGRYAGLIKSAVRRAELQEQIEAGFLRRSAAARQLTRSSGSYRGAWQPGEDGL